LLLKISRNANGQTLKTLVRRVALAMPWHRVAHLSVISVYLRVRFRSRATGSGFNNHEFLYLLTSKE